MRVYVLLIKTGISSALTLFCYIVTELNVSSLIGGFNRGRVIPGRINPFDTTGDYSHPSSSAHLLMLCNWFTTLVVDIIAVWSSWLPISPVPWFSFPRDSVLSYKKYFHVVSGTCSRTLFAMRVSVQRKYTRKWEPRIESALYMYMEPLRECFVVRIGFLSYKNCINAYTQSERVQISINSKVLCMCYMKNKRNFSTKSIDTHTHLAHVFHSWKHLQSIQSNKKTK